MEPDSAWLRLGRPSGVTGRADGSTAERLQLCLDLNRGGHVVFGCYGRIPAVQGYLGRTQPFTPGEIRSWGWNDIDSLGWSVRPGRMIFDVDVKGGKHGDEQLRDLERKLGPLPPTAGQRTPSGGWHLLFGVPRSMAPNSGFLRTVSGGRADIDVLDCGHRYARLYAPRFMEGDVADLPGPWLEWLTLPRPRLPSASPSGLPRLRGNQSEELLEELRKAPIGQRNDTLNQVTFTLARPRELPSQTRQALVGIAKEIGLGEEEVCRTIESAEKSARENRLPSQKWLSAVIEALDRSKVRNRPALRRTAAAIAEVSNLHGSEFSLSVRELAERAGINHVTASRHLSRLKSLGLLMRVSALHETQATVYRLIVPDQSSPGCNTHPQVPSGIGQVKGDGGSVLHVAHETSGHDAFIRLRGGWNLSPGAAEVLSVVEQHDTTLVAEVVAETGLSRSTVYKAIRALADAEIIIVEKSGRRLTLRPNTGSLLSRLDNAATFYSADGRGEAKREQHRRERTLNRQDLIRKSRIRTTEGQA